MKTFVKKSRLIPAALFLTMLTAISTDASATAYAKWCTHWLSTYTDAGYGEDVFTSPNPLYRDAKYTHARVERFGSSTPLWEGTLDSSGCVPENLVLLANKKYIFTQWTYAERSNRQIWVNIDTSEFGENAVSFTTTMTTPSSLEDKVYNYTIYPNYDNPKSNLMPIAGRILEKYSTLSMPSGTDTYIHTDSYHCGGGGAYYQGSGEICVLGEQSLSWSDVTTWKFIVAHEIGHRVADANGAPLGGDYSHSGAPYQCRCDYVTHGSQLHCLMSREEGETAQAEGFAHFFAAATFNNRTEDDLRNPLKNCL
jgi:hypothetical protein